MVLKLYVDLLSQPARALALFVKKANIPHELKIVSIMKGEHKTQEYIDNVHPFGKIPAIDDNGFKMIESIAIIRYLARKYNVDDHWYPKDIEKQARVDEFLEWQHMSERIPLSLFFLNTYLKPMLTGKKLDDNRLQKYKSQMEDSLNDIENVWLKDSQYLVGNEISVADLVGISEIEQPRISNYDVTAGRPRIAAWMKRVQNDLQPHYDDVFKILNKLASKNASKL
ncbi:GSTD1-5 protein, putative [Pediculus humanus corporis]|uniref:glutathione transferase n=1 Tax=Pediculus humanus subsp. corporis TaxID=121224 RepID=E0VUR9_PEDHC|nr:GSTD1-5 protein, putative [Pediculus humanus corporis]EEB17125.1 GSTD1-5 protein, putative [Pediculus humanus corporis]